MTSPRGCTNLKLRQLSRLVSRHYERHFSDAGLKGTQYSLLSHVVLMGPIGAGDLADAVRLSPSALTRAVQPLLARGLVAVTPGDDARSRTVEATAEGRALRQALQRDWKRAQLALNERLGADRVAALHALIDDCTARLDDGAAEGDDR